MPRDLTFYLFGVLFDEIDLCFALGKCWMTWKILLTASKLLPTPSACNFIDHKGRKYKDGKEDPLYFLVYPKVKFLSPNRGKKKTWRVFINRTE